MIHGYPLRPSSPWPWCCWPSPAGGLKMSSSLRPALDPFRQQSSPEDREMARRLKAIPLGELTELLCLVALNYVSIFTASGQPKNQGWVKIETVGNLPLRPCVTGMRAASSRR